MDSRDRIWLEAEASMAQEEMLVHAVGYLRGELPRQSTWPILDRALRLAWLAGRETGVRVKLAEVIAERDRIEAELRSDPPAAPPGSRLPLLLTWLRRLLRRP